MPFYRFEGSVRGSKLDPWVREYPEEVDKNETSQPDAQSSSAGDRLDDCMADVRDGKGRRSVQAQLTQS